MAEDVPKDATFDLYEQRYSLFPPHDFFDDRHHHSLGPPPYRPHEPDSMCFMAGTRIKAPLGEINVEDLKPGDLVLTKDGRMMPVRWIGRQTVLRRFVDETRLPVRLKAGALGENTPSRDLLVSDQHALFVDGILIQAGALINGSTVMREFEVSEIFVFYHIELDEHLLVLAENVPAETFVDNVDRTRFDNWHEYEALYPTGKNVGEMPYPRAKAARQVPDVIRARLAKRAAEISNDNRISAA
jgi:hypothetical protein